MTQREYYKAIIEAQVNYKTAASYENKFFTLLEMNLDTREATDRMMNSIFANINLLSLKDMDDESKNLIEGIKANLFNNAFLGLQDIEIKQELSTKE